MLDAIIADNPAKKLAFERWDQLAQKRDAVATYFARSEIRCPVSEFEIVPFLEEVQAADPEQFSSLPSYDIARLLKARREHRGWEDESPTEAQKAVLRSKRIPYEGLTKGQASELINTIYNGATEGQVRRLQFYGIDSEGLTKKEACIIIDDYIAANPDAENDYQRWKINNGLA